ncbi:unnamed protein product [Callosobruchus maculatus]|uniref:Uncharacterized protein n=2 Tax=Callosobruchus maculatus TaxID=64391 RepID=A0A653DSB0_CALMS|nr:unnamed protein product [Callosobruchus maculatus]
MATPTPTTSRSSSASFTARSRKSKTNKSTPAEEAYRTFGATAVELNEHVASISHRLDNLSETVHQTMTNLTETVNQAVDELMEERRRSNALMERQNELLAQLLQCLKKE